MPDSPHLFITTANTNLGPYRATDTPGVWRKDYIRDGRWRINNDISLRVDAERRQHWADTFQLMKSRGITVPLTVDHIQVTDGNGNVSLKRVDWKSALAKIGDVVNLFSEGDAGWFDAKPADLEAEKILLRNPEVSLECQSFVDGMGNVYRDAITAITLTSTPVVPDQEEWRMIAASRNTDTNPMASSFLMANPLLESRTSSTKGNAMFKPDHKKAICMALNMAESTEDEKLADAVYQHIMDHATKEKEREGKMSRLAELETKTTADDQTIKELQEKLTASQPVKLSRDMEAELTEGMEDRIERMVGQAFTPAVAKDLKKWITQDGPLMLSREASGRDKARYKELLEILGANKIDELHELLTKQVKGQRTQLSRDNLHSDDPPKLTTAEALEKGWGVKPAATK